jgi:hypothetical protein
MMANHIFADDNDLLGDEDALFSGPSMKRAKLTDDDSDILGSWNTALKDVKAQRLEMTLEEYMDQYNPSAPREERFKLYERGQYHIS